MSTPSSHLQYQRACKGPSDATLPPGIKADADRAKAAVLEAGVGYNAAIPGVGAAWSHNFLNQKPWHPLNFRNQVCALLQELTMCTLSCALAVRA